MPRRMADEEFRRDQEEHAFDPHMAPVNALVDRISDPDGREWMPYVAPMHGGADATVLSLTRDPRPATQRHRGSGFVSLENDDPVAEHQWHRFAEAGIHLRTVLPWNAYPWYTPRTPTPAELEAGVNALARLVAVAPALQVVLLQGRTPREAWRVLLDRFPETARGIKAIPAPSPRRTVARPGAAARAERLLEQREAFRLVGQVLR